jgi:hypothetical protein
VKFRKIQPKRTGDDEGTVEIGNTENRHGDFRVNQPRRFVPETGQYLLKIGKWNKKTVENNVMTSTKFVHANSP